MAKAKKADPGSPKKKLTGYRLRPAFQPLADALARRLGTDVTELVNQAFRERLEREGLWPPPDALEGLLAQVQAAGLDPLVIFESALREAAAGRPAS